MSFADTFTRADATNLGVDWEPASGQFGIASNQAAVQNGSTTCFATAEVAASSDDLFAQVTVAVVGGTSLMVLGRAQQAFGTGEGGGAGTPGGWYGFRWNGTTMQLVKGSGVSTGITVIGTQSAQASLANGAVLRVECEGSTIRGYLDGALRCTATDTTYSGATNRKGGLRVFGPTTVRLDDFSTGALAATPAGQSFDVAPTLAAVQPGTDLTAAAGPQTLDVSAGGYGDGGFGDGPFGDEQPGADLTQPSGLTVQVLTAGGLRTATAQTLTAGGLRTAVLTVH